jgi:predicted transcriptional regulator
MASNVLTFDYEEALPRLQVLADIVSHKIILSTIEEAKTAQQIASENELPLSSTYKKIKKLQTMDLLCVERISLDDTGKRVLYYKSRIKSVEFSLRKVGSLLQLERNEIACKCSNPYSKLTIEN